NSDHQACTVSVVEMVELDVSAVKKFSWTATLCCTLKSRLVIPHDIRNEENNAIKIMFFICRYLLFFNGHTCLSAVRCHSQIVIGVNDQFSVMLMSSFQFLNYS